MHPILGMEVVTGFFVEAGFIGILLYGDGRVRQGTTFAATVMVALGTLLSSTWNHREQLVDADPVRVRGP